MTNHPHFQLNLKSRVRDWSLLFTLVFLPLVGVADDIQDFKKHEAISYLNKITGTYHLDVEVRRDSVAERSVQTPLYAEYVRVLITHENSYSHPIESIQLTAENFDSAKLVVERVTGSAHHYRVDTEIMNSFKLSELRFDHQSLKAIWPDERRTESSAHGKVLQTNDRLIIDPKNEKLIFASDSSGIGRLGADYRSTRRKIFNFTQQGIYIEDQSRYHRRKLSRLNQFGQVLGMVGEPQWEQVKGASRNVLEGRKIEQKVLPIESIGAKDGLYVDLVEIGSTKKYIGIKPLTHPPLPDMTQQEIYNESLDRALDEIAHTPKTFFRHDNFMLGRFLDRYIPQYHRDGGVRQFHLSGGKVSTVADYEPGILGRLLPEGITVLGHNFPQLFWLQPTSKELRATLVSAGLREGSLELDLILTEAMVFALRLQSSREGGSQSHTEGQLMQSRLHLEIIAAAMEFLGLHESTPRLIHEILSVLQNRLPKGIQNEIQFLRNSSAKYKYLKAPRYLTNGLDIYTSRRKGGSKPRAMLCRSLF